jgi:uncharacterized damage-inducible protein DinB
MPSANPFLSMAYNNRWSNYRLDKACVLLSQSDFEAPRTGYFPSLRATLNHILIVDRFYLDAFEGGMLGSSVWSNPEPCETALVLLAAQSEVDERLITFVEPLDSVSLMRTVSLHFGSRVSSERVDRILLHLFQHQIHHRGQAHAMLSGTSVPPPQLDEFMLSGDAATRESDFRELDWSEELIWKGA